MFLCTQVVERDGEWVNQIRLAITLWWIWVFNLVHLFRFALACICNVARFSAVMTHKISVFPFHSWMTRFPATQTFGAFVVVVGSWLALTYFGGFRCFNGRGHRRFPGPSLFTAVEASYENSAISFSEASMLRAFLNACSKVSISNFFWICLRQSPHTNRSRSASLRCVPKLHMDAKYFRLQQTWTRSCLPVVHNCGTGIVRLLLAFSVRNEFLGWWQVVHMSYPKELTENTSLRGHRRSWHQ